MFRAAKIPEGPCVVLIAVRFTDLAFPSPAIHLLDYKGSSLESAACLLAIIYSKVSFLSIMLIVYAP